MAVPRTPKLYHITHLDNLPSIIRDGGLWSDAELMARGGPAESIGMSNIKRRRLTLPVKCHAGDFVGSYVPFYFCPRSIMLYLLHRGNHPEVTYHGGQTPILHLELDLHATVEWAVNAGHRWAFSLANAGAVYTEFRDDLGQLDEVDWESVVATDFRDPEVKEGKQAEFLVQRFVPWSLVQRIGVHTEIIQRQVMRTTSTADHRPLVEVCRTWYF